MNDLRRCRAKIDRDSDYWKLSNKYGFEDTPDAKEQLERLTKRMTRVPLLCRKLDSSCCFPLGIVSFPSLVSILTVGWFALTAIAFQRHEKVEEENRETSKINSLLVDALRNAQSLLKQKAGEAFLQEQTLEAFVSRR